MRIKLLLILPLIGLLLSACAPDIETSYQYISPQSFRARECINRCLNAYQSCKLRCQNQQNQCQFMQNTNNTLNWALDNQNNNMYGPGYVPPAPAYYCNQGGDCGCGDTYRQCYVNCGGTIIVHQECVANCDSN